MEKKIMEEKQYYKEKRISSSSLKYFEQSPLLFKKFLDSELEQESKKFFEKGKQIHMAILEPEEFKKNFTTLDFEIPKSEQQKQFCEEYIETISKQKKISEDVALINAYKNNYKAAKSDEKILEDAQTLKNKLIRYIEYLQKRKTFKDILSWSDWQRIQSLKEGIVRHKLANELLKTDDLDTRLSWNELVIFWEDPTYNLPCKSMIDRLVVDHDKKEIILIDLKTANTFTKFKERCNEFAYFRQMAFYWFAIHWWFKNALNKDISEYNKQTYIIGLKTTDDAEVRVYKIQDIHLREGLVDINNILGDLAWHWENDKWDHTRNYYVGEGYETL